MNKKKGQSSFVKSINNKSVKYKEKEKLIKENKLVISKCEEKDKKPLIELINTNEVYFDYVYYNYIKIIRSINLNEWYKIKNKWINTDSYYQSARGKYFSIKTFIIYNLQKLYIFNLHNEIGKEILDLGCGGGLLLYILKLNNNKVLGLDVKFELFDDMLNFFGITKIVEKIRPHQKIKNLTQKFDIITATSITFDTPLVYKNWTTYDWLFFLNDIKEYLKKDGKLYLDLNKYDKIPGYNDKIEKFFLKMNAEQFSKNQFMFKK